MAVTGPWGVATAAITTSADGIAGFEISKGLRGIHVGVSVPNVSWNKHIYM